VWVLELDGSPVERGKAEGVLLGEQIRWLLPRYLRKVASVDKLSNYQKELVAAIGGRHSSAHFDQLNALADAAKVDRTALFAVNLAQSCFLHWRARAWPPRQSEAVTREFGWHATSIGLGATSGRGWTGRHRVGQWPPLCQLHLARAGQRGHGHERCGAGVADLMALGTGTTVRTPDCRCCRAPQLAGKIRQRGGRACFPGIHPANHGAELRLCR